MRQTGNLAVDLLVDMVATRTADTMVHTQLTPELVETLRLNQFVIDHLLYEMNRKDELISHLLKPFQK